MVVEAIVGFLIGAAIAIIPRTPKGRRHAFGFALVGALLAIGLAWILARFFTSSSSTRATPLSSSPA